MKRILLSVFSLAVCISVFAQANSNVIGQKNVITTTTTRTCGIVSNEQMLQAQDPNRAAQRQAYEQQVQAWIATHQNQITTQAAITIPVVVHVVYQNAAENISDNQVFSQIEVLNEDFTATNSDIGSVPSVWTSIVGNIDVNFCMAQQTPTGGITNGIDRVSTTDASFSTDNQVKFAAQGGANQWDPTRYFNIWVCDLGGSLLGYGEFPTGSPTNTYGLVVGYYCFGSNYTSYGSGFSFLGGFDRGRTATHEIGHCFNLNHIWGDDGTGCGGTDNVNDTPNQADENYGCPAFPNVSCSNGPNGDMFMNYMDYVDDACMFMFTNGQKSRMLAVINGPAYGTLQTSNACTTPANAPPVAMFTSALTTCPSTPVTFTNQTTINATSWTWTFPSGTPSSSTLQNPPTVTWTAPGTYTVTLVATNVNGTSTYTRTITVLGTVNPPLTEGFEAATFVPANWSQNDAGSNGLVWERANAGRNSSYSAMFNNFVNNVNGTRDDMRTPRMNFSSASTVTMTFDVAYRRYSNVAAETDTLEVLYSTNCGASWTQVYIKGGATLATVTGTQTTAFVPTNTQWRAESINLNAAAGQSGVLIAFRNRGHWGNNIYVDNVNITTTVSTLPNGVFTASATSVCRGTPVSFTDNSTNSPTSWTWTFPSGTPANATTQNVASVVWNTAGTYTVTHTATNGSGTGTTTQTITVLPTPTVTATASSNTICNGSSTTLTGGGATTYNWMPGSIAGSPVTVSPTGTTTYTVTGTGANGCTSTQTRTITVNPLPAVTATSTATAICSGSSITLTGGGANTYAWMPGSLTGTSVTVSPTVTTTYTVTGTGANGCTNTATRTITVNPSPTVTTTATSTTICNGSSTTITASGATTYTWMPGSLTGTSVTVSPATTTTYTVTGTSSGCSATATRLITVNPSPTVTSTTSNATICNGGSTTLTGGGASTYAWMPGSLTGSPVTVSPTTTTTYTVTGTAANGCTNTATRTITVNPSPTVTATSGTATICAGGSTTLTGSGASTYSWMPGNLNGGTVTVSPTGTTTYTVTGTGANGCTATQTVIVSVTPSPTVTTTTTSATICAGSSTTITASGATTYTWMPGSLTGTSVTVSPATTTTYTVTGSNGGCTSTATRTITVNPAPTLTVTPAAASICPGGSVSIAGSTTAGCTYSWSPIAGLSAPTAATTNASPATTTTYVLTKTRTTTGCTNTGSVVVTVLPTPTVTASASTNSICTGNSVTLTGGGANTYAWMPGSLSGTTVTVTPASTTTYTVTGTGANGCTGTGTVAITVGAQPVVTASTSAASICTGGSATLTGNGGTTYTWMPGSLTGSSVSVSPAATTTYTVTGTNGPGCSNTATVMVTVNALPSVSASASSPAVCIGDAVTLTGSGASSYDWMPGSLSGTTVTDAPAASTTYTVTGTDGNGCSNTSTVNVAVNSLPSVSASASASDICMGSSVTLTGSGANSYDWMPGALNGTTVTDAPTSAITYTVTGTDANGCSNTSTVNVNVNALPNVSASASSNDICMGSSVTLTGSGANSYDWMPGALNGTTVTDAPTSATTYTVTGTDGNGCSNTSTVSVNVNALPNVSASASSNDICMGNSVTLTGSGANSYDWMPGSLNGTTVTDAPTSATTYTVTGTDANGCSNTSTVSVNVNAGPAVSIALATDTFCDIDGPTALMGGSPAGGTYTGPGVSGNAFDASSLGAGTYTIMYTFTDGNGCTDSASQNVTVDICMGIAAPQEGTPISVMPNPNNGNFALSFNAAASDDYVIEIHNALGQVVYSEQLTDFSGVYRKDISLEAFGRGMYTVRLRTVTAESVIRVITQ